MVEFKIGRYGPVLMEINGRVWGSMPLALQSGVDFPRAMAELSLFGRVSPSVIHNGDSEEEETPVDEGTTPPYRTGVHARNLELDLVWIASVLLQRRRFAFLPMPQRREALRAMLGLLNPTVRFDILSLRDPRPGLVELCKTLAKFVKHRN